jgi:hypothetical protein
MPETLYVYYKVDLQRGAEFERAARDLVARVAAATGVQGRLLRRRDAPATWMEVYDAIPAGLDFEAILHAALGASGLQGLLAPDARHMERFVPLERA